MDGNALQSSSGCATASRGQSLQLLVSTAPKEPTGPYHTFICLTQAPTWNRIFTHARHFHRYHCYQEGTCTWLRGVWEPKSHCLGSN